MGDDIKKAYLGIKFHADNSNRGRIEMISDVLESCGFGTVCIQRDVEGWGEIALTPAELMSQTFEIIRGCQVVVIELSEKGVGLGIEAGYAFAQEIPIIVIAENGRDISTTLQGIAAQVFFYKSAQDLKQQFALSVMETG